MNKQTDITAPSEKKASREDVASAMMELETVVFELMHMSDITAETYDATFSPRSRIKSDDPNAVTYRLTKHEDEQMSFLINNVATRCSRLHKSFHAACNGEVSV